MQWWGSEVATVERPFSLLSRQVNNSQIPFLVNSLSASSLVAHSPDQTAVRSSLRAVRGPYFEKFWELKWCKEERRGRESFHDRIELNGHRSVDDHLSEWLCRFVYKRSKRWRNLDWFDKVSTHMNLLAGPPFNHLMHIFVHTHLII